MYSEAEQAYIESIEKLDLQDTKGDNDCCLILLVHSQNHCAASRERRSKTVRTWSEARLAAFVTNGRSAARRHNGRHVTDATAIRQKAPTYQQVAIAIGVAFTHQVRFEKWVSKDKRFATRFLKATRTCCPQKCSTNASSLI